MGRRTSLVGMRRIITCQAACSRRPAIFRAAVAAVAIAMPLSLQAAEVTSTWKGSSGNWTDSSKWLNDPAMLGYPGSTSTLCDVLIVGPNTGFTVTLNTGVLINALTLDAKDSVLNQTSGKLTLGADSSITCGSYLLTGGTLAGQGNLLVSGTLAWNGGDMDAGGKTTIASAGNLQIAGPYTKSLKRTLDNSGTIAHSESSIYLQGTLNNLSPGNFTINSGYYYNSGGAFNNAGSFTKAGNAEVRMYAAFNNTGSVNVQGGILRLDKGA
ncbi:MAG TPA: hypothetical protein VHP11_06240, partial [Tepidisphaeraceae bacterium]|nr:hypothetical protein [Tepidisphaeraceae bacterium]